MKEGKRGKKIEEKHKQRKEGIIVKKTKSRPKRGAE
jgi:hypothetical protein